MGYNTVAVILNDALGAIERDSHFGENVSKAVRNWHLRDRDSLATYASASGRFGALQVISLDHADGEQVVIVQGNTGRRCDEANDLGWMALSQMQACLERHGYTVKKRRKPGPIDGRPDHG